MGRRRGFSLVELVVIVSICGLLFSLSFPTLANFRSRLSLETAARGMASDLRKCQASAMSKGETVACAGTKFKFSSSGFPPPGGSGTYRMCGKKKIILSSAGRVRIE
jgi:Tfp pilus assembly protein FimT